MLGPGGFDPARDITAITVNRWPHGYAYEYNPLFDPDWQKGRALHEVGRTRFGPIAIANSDSAAAAYTDVAIDQAHRAVTELCGLTFHHSRRVTERVRIQLPPSASPMRT
jgi:spermidine dehydrogenase